MAISKAHAHLSLATLFSFPSIGCVKGKTLSLPGFSNVISEISFQFSLLKAASGAWWHTDSLSSQEPMAWQSEASLGYILTGGGEKEIKKKS